MSNLNLHNCSSEFWTWPRTFKISFNEQKSKQTRRLTVSSAVEWHVSAYNSKPNHWRNAAACSTL